MYDPHDLYVAASEQLEAEGVDAYDLRSKDSTLAALRLVDLCFRMRRNGSFKHAPEESIQVIRKELAAIEYEETQAIAEELEAQHQDQGDALYDRLKEEGYGYG